MKTSRSLFDIKMCKWMLIFIGLFLFKILEKAKGAIYKF